MAVSWHRPESWCQAWFDPFGLPTISIHDPAVCMHATQSIPWSCPPSLLTSQVAPETKLFDLKDWEMTH
jgi:hypothetical protein